MVNFFRSSLFPFHHSSILLSVYLSIFPLCLSFFSTSLCPAIYPSVVLLSIHPRAAIFFSMPKVNVLLCGWILSTTGNFTCSNKGQSSTVSRNRFDRLWPLMKSLETISCLPNQLIRLVFVFPCLLLPSFLFSFLASFLVLFYFVKQYHAVL